MAQQVTVSSATGNIQIQVSRAAIGTGGSGFSGISGASGFSGTSGRSGYSGAQGAQGISGYSGISGISGYSGTSGYSGPAGANGSQGASGISGYSGAPGAASASGYSGVSGSSGISGYSGAAFVGSSGYSGISGYSGASGISGIDGLSGYSGVSGESGISGYSGISGDTGPQGISGYSGLDGASGYSGTSGYSAAIGGANTQVQFNDDNTANGSSSFTFNKTTNTANLANLNITGGLTFTNNNVSPDIVVTANASNTTTRQLFLRASSLYAPTIGSNQTAGGVRIEAGESNGTTQTTAWIARGGSVIQYGGNAISNTGNAIGGGYNLFGGFAQSLLTGNATGGGFLITGGDTIANVGRGNGGPLNMFGGGGFAETGNTIGGDIVIAAGAATSNVSGTARGGNVVVDVNTANGVTGSVQGNIYIGTGTFSGATPQVVSIGSTSTPANIEGNLNVIGDSTLGNLATANYFSGDGGLLSNIAVSNVQLKYGQVSSNATQTVAGANTATYATFNNTGLASGVSIVANSNVTIANAGKYNLQFSAQVENPDNQDAILEIWFDKNGNALPDSATQLVLQKDLTSLITVNYLENIAANDYIRIGYAANTANVFLQAVDQANTIANISSVPSIILTATQIG